jgi:hypothetical protein
MQRSGSAIVTLALCLAGCGARTESNAVGAGNESVANAAAGNAAAGANAVAGAQGGPCPFETRNVRATTGPSPAPEGGQQVTITVGIRTDSEGSVPMLSQRLTPPPELVLDIDRDPMATPSTDREWGEAGIGGYPATPAYTHAVVRCLGAEIARVPIQR